MRIRPARATRTINSQAWARYSIKKPRKNYIKALPHTSLLIFKMGVAKPDYDMKFTLESQSKVQLRSNAIEAARQAANKYLEKVAANDYLLLVLPYPHNVIREHKMATGAGADRISQGMSLSFGSPTGVAARLNNGSRLFELMTYSENKAAAKEAFRRALSKLSGSFKVKAEQIRVGSEGNEAKKAQQGTAKAAEAA